MRKLRKIIFFGNEQIATGVKSDAIIFSYLAKNYDVKCLVISEKNHDKELAVVKIANKYSIPIIVATRLMDNIDELKKYAAEMGILISFGKIVPEKIINIFPKGIINLHPSLLPKHRGSTPVESVILGGEKETGISLMSLVPQMDAGPIYAQKKITLSGNETKQSLAEELIKLGLNTLQNHLEAIINGKLKPEIQNESLATFDSRISKQDGYIDWSWSSIDIYNKIRAYQGWPTVECNLKHLRVKIIRARICTDQGDLGSYKIDRKRLIFFTKDSSIEILDIQPVGKKIMTTEQFLAGYSNRLE